MALNSGFNPFKKKQTPETPSAEKKVEPIQITLEQKNALNLALNESGLQLKVSEYAADVAKLLPTKDEAEAVRKKDMSGRADLGPLGQPFAQFMIVPVFHVRINNEDSYVILEGPPPPEKVNLHGSEYWTGGLPTTEQIQTVFSKAGAEIVDVKWVSTFSRSGL